MAFANQLNLPVNDLYGMMQITLPRDGRAPMTGALDMGANCVINIANATAATDALNRQYADARYVGLAGGAMTGALAAPVIAATGANAGVTTQRRDNPAFSSDFYATEGLTRISSSATGDLLRLADDASSHLLNAGGAFRQIWHAGNLTPSSLAPLSGATFTGPVAAPQVSSSGATAGFNAQRRDNSAWSSSFYADAGQTRISSSFAGDLLRLADDASSHELNVGGTFRQIWHTGNFNPADYLPLSGGTLIGDLTTNGSIFIRSVTPAIQLIDTSWGASRWVYANEGLVGFLNSSGNWDMYSNNAGHIWTSSYGFLHDFFLHRIRTTGISDQQVSLFSATGLALDSPWVVTGLYSGIGSDGNSAIFYRARILQMFYSGAWWNVNAS